MTLRLLFATLIAAAMLFAPFSMRGAMAAAPADHRSQMKATDHCDGRVPQDRDHKSTDKPCCVAMCIAVALEPTAQVEPIDFGRIVERPSLAERPENYLAELPTPPPRAA